MDFLLSFVVVACVVAPVIFVWFLIMLLFGAYGEMRETFLFRDDLHWCLSLYFIILHLITPTIYYIWG